MTETIIKETVEGEAGAVEEPTQPTSETQAAPSAVDEASLKAIVEPLVEELLGRQTQSIKDKRIAKQESRISSIEDTLAQLKELKADGMSEKQAIQYMETQDFLISQGQIVPAAVAPLTEEPAVQPTVAPDALLSSVLNIAGLESSDADVIEIMRDNPNNPTAQAIAVNQLVQTRKQTKPPTPAAALSSGGGKAVETDTIDSVTAELEAERAKPIRDRERMNELGDKLRGMLPRE